MATKSTGKKSSAAKSAKSTKTTRAKAGSQNRNDDVFAPILKKIKGTSWLGIFESLVIGVFGVLLLVDPNAVTEAIFYIVGIFLMIKGVYKIVNYFAVHGRYDFYNNDLLYGVIALVFGLIAVIFWEQLRKIISVAVGVWMIYGALVRMNTAIKMHSANIGAWLYVLLLAMVMLALGLYLIISTTAAETIIGWVMLAAAVVGIVDDVIFLRKLDEFQK